VSLKKDVEEAKTHPEAPLDRIRKTSLSPYVAKLSFDAGCNVQKLTEGLVLKKIKYGLNASM
jgi:hypothetical protein